MTVTPIKTDYDVVVVGSGAAGLTAALAAAHAGSSVLVLEASDRWGGSTAVSGGLVWSPDNHHMGEAGVDDSFADALDYCLSSGFAREQERVEAFLRASPRAVRFIEENSPINFRPIAYPDTFAEGPGGKRAARHLEAEPIDPGPLGRWQDLLWTKDEPHTMMSEILPIGAHVYGLPLDLDAVRERRAAGRVTGGAALVIGLLQGIDDAGVERHSSSRVTSLLMDADAVTGVVITQGDDVSELRATQGVVLATGGFEWNSDLKARHLSTPITHQVTPPVQRGDGLRLAAEAGAELAHLHENWSWPAVEVPSDTWDDQPRHHLSFSERYMPHSLWVNSHGRRFVNESSHNASLALGEIDTSAHTPRNLPCWAIMDAKFRERYQVAGVLPGEPSARWIVEAETLGELATAIGVDGGELWWTVDRFNTFVSEGQDQDFARGETLYENAMGDPTAPHPNLGSVDTGPFVAVRIHPSTVGTKGGALTNEHAEVVAHSGAKIPGLYAAGNAMAAVFGPGISGGGMTIGNAVAWGWLAGTNAGSEDRR